MLTGAEIQGADFKGANISGAVFDTRALRGTELRELVASTYRAPSDAEIGEALARPPRRLEAQGKDGQRAVLSDADLGGRQLARVQLALAVLTNGKLTNTNSRKQASR